MLSAASPDSFPRLRAPEIALIGRSNVGKSSLINRLVGVNGLAYTSARPGCTRTINFYRVGSAEGTLKEFRLVDLPGYGFAAGPIADKIAWKALIDAYLTDREDLRFALLLIDSRRGWMDADRQMREWLEHHDRPYVVVATKIDKLNARERSSGLAAIRKELNGRELVLFSAPEGRGVREIWHTITNITTT